MNRKKDKQLVVLIILLALILAALVVTIIWMDKTSQSDDPVITETTSAPTEEPTETTEPSTEPSTEPLTEPVTEPSTEPSTEPVTEPATEPATAPATKPTAPPATAPTTQPTEPPATEPSVTDPAQILSLAQEKLRGLSGDIKEVGSVDSPKYLSVKVSVATDAESASQTIVNQFKDVLHYEQSQSNPNVAVGNPNPLTYEYKLSYAATVDGQHEFVFEYRFISTNYEVSNQSYDTGRMVADVCAHLNSLGKTKFDSQTTEYVSSQPVIVPLEHPYETALSIVKAQVESISAQFRDYDFYYSALTITTKGGVEQEALLFYIVNK